MNYKMMGKFISQILFVEAAFMLPALLLSIVYGEQSAVRGFIGAIIITLIVAAIMYVLCRNAVKRFYAREGLVCVGMSWIALSIMGCLPFFISREIPDFLDALFEIVSGFTTTGSSILTDVEALSHGLLYWRSFSHWLGGMGVLVFLLAVVPRDRGGSGFTLHILRAESPGPNVGKLVPKMHTTARILYVIYVLLTIINIVFLLFGGMPVFEAVCTAMGTAGTGGFGIKNDSMASYSPYIQNVCMVFMLLFGVNFSCYYLLLVRHFKTVFKDQELRMYIAIVLGSIVLITWNLHGFYSTLGETVRHAAFQVATVITTTGFATTDFDLWPSFSKGILLALMFLGACAGSTGGGIKVSRVVLLFRSLTKELSQSLHPNQVRKIHFEGRAVDHVILRSVNVFIAAYILIFAISVLLIGIDNYDLVTNFTAVAATLNNIGPGLELVGPAQNFGLFSNFSKLVLTFDKIGRAHV